ncbi:unnamed protein product [Adineta ricciae]|uniref:Uncharacterized protein n=1 Tax=Adineta ricciae TaxID=249248 RepID=A0A815DBK8_ADIRI|nr:unnamed protein product [Adineta ricciae]CAF1294145.1 unnamed protein product [Adineta ricciae]
MSSPYAHTHVSHLVKKKRRRSQSLTLPNFNDLDSQVQNESQKKFLAQLKKERQKQQNIQEHDNSKDHSRSDDDDFQATVTRIPRTYTSASMKKTALSTTAISVSTKQQMSTTTTTFRAAGVYDSTDDFQPVVTRVGTTATALSSKKHTSTTGKDILSAAHKTTNLDEGDLNSSQQTHIIRIPREESSKSMKNPFSNLYGKFPSGSLPRKVMNTTCDTPISHNDIDINSSQNSSNHFDSSTTNILRKSDVVDQEFRLDDGKDHARRNDAKSHGSIKIGERENYYAVHGKNHTTKTSASLMASIIAILIGLIAFALALTAFILVLLLRSTVDANLVITPKKSIGSLPSACSNYTPVDDPTRSINAPGYALGCDNTAPFANQSSPAWIRFIGTGGTTLPLQTPGMNICGSEGTGWYYGTMPSITGEVVNGTACFSWYTSVCRFSVSIIVANCGSFYIYRLPPAPACMMRYCTI